MQNTKDFLMRFHLQFFAEGAAAGDGGEGGAASATGVNSGDAGRAEDAARSLEEMGVPKDRAEAYRARKAKAQGMTSDGEGTLQSAQSADCSPEEGTAAEVKPAEQAEKGQDAAARGLKWEDVIADPEINKKLQETVSGRTKKLRGALDELAPALAVIGSQYGIDMTDMSKADFKALAKAVTEDDRYYESKALEMGADVKLVKRMENLEADKRRRDAEDAQRRQDEALRSHYDGLRAQAEELKKQFPGFNLEAELNNPAFMRMTSPGGGLSVKQAYYAVHADEITAAKQAETARQVSAAISNSIRAGQRMPQENGAGSKAAGGVAAKPYSQMNAKEREAYRKLLQSGQIKY